MGHAPAGKQLSRPATPQSWPSPDSARCRTHFQGTRNGHVAVSDASQRTSLPCILVAGDCAGIWESKTLDEEIARREGRIAAKTALAALGVETEQYEIAVKPDDPFADSASQRSAWVLATTLAAQSRPHVCLCEEVTASEIIGNLPPRYLGWLAREGVDVLVLEAGLIGWGASGRNGGGCSHHHSPLFLEEQRLWPMLDELLGYPTEYRPDRISIALNEHQLSLDQKVVGEIAHYGMHADLLDPKLVRELVPFAGDNVLAGYYYHLGGHANPHRTLQAYAWALQDLGGRILENTAVTGFARQGRKVTGVHTAQGLISCDQLVIAAGPHTGKLAAQLDVDIPLVTARAEMIVTEPLPLMEVGGVDGNGLYGRQTLRGNLAYGGGPHEWVDLKDLQGSRPQSTPLQCFIAKRLAELFPKIAHKRMIRSWAGFIENTPDGRPVIDRPASLENVTVATMSGVGFGLSPASGHAIRDLVLDQVCSFADLSTFSLSRFAGLEPDWQTIQGWLPLPIPVQNESAHPAA